MKVMVKSKSVIEPVKIREKMRESLWILQSLTTIEKV